MGDTELLRDGEWLSEKCAEMTDQEIADFVGCTQENIVYWRRKHNIERNSYPELQDEEWLLEKLETNTQAEVAEEVGCTQSSVSGWARRHRS